VESELPSQPWISSTVPFVLDSLLECRARSLSPLPPGRIILSADLVMELTGGLTLRLVRTVCTMGCLITGLGLKLFRIWK
jgi:hypothetical protein